MEPPERALHIISNDELKQVSVKMTVLVSSIVAHDASNSQLKVAPIGVEMADELYA